MDRHFQYPHLFWLLLALPVFILLFAYILHWKKTTRKKIGDARLVDELTRSYSAPRFANKYILMSLAFAIGVLAAANLREPGGRGGLERKGIDVVMALDLSKSMLATDLQPTRLEKAKQLMLKLVDQMPNDRIALVFFAGRAYMQMPLTVDHASAKLFISSASPDAIASQGTVISEALQMSSRAFNSKEGRFKSVILISDGEDHDAGALSTSAELAGQGVMVNTIGVGSPGGAAIIDALTGMEKKDAMGNTIISKLNEEGLKAIADATNGRYIYLQDTDEAVTSVLDQLSQIERKAFGDTSLMNYKTWYWIFVILMLLILLAEFILPERKKLKK